MITPLFPEPVSTGSRGDIVQEGSGVRFRKSKSSGKQSSDESGTVNGIRPLAETTDAPRQEEEEEEEEPQWNFPPTLDDFNLMECDEDPARLEEMFADKRYRRTNVYTACVCVCVCVTCILNLGSLRLSTPL